MTEFLTIPQIVNDIIANRLDESDLEYLRSENDQDNLIMLHHTFGQWIRNTYSLWDQQNPHTLLNYQPELVDDVDMSPKHPDAVSMDIITRVWKILNGN